MKIQDVMRTELRTCRKSDSLSAAARIMWDGDCGIVPVTDAEGRLCGVVTDRDACMAAYTKGASLAQIPVADAMASRVVTLRPEDGLDKAHELMRSHRIRRLPVIDAQHRLLGVVSLKDLADAAQQGKQPKPREEVARTLSAICRPRVAVET